MTDVKSEAPAAGETEVDPLYERLQKCVGCSSGAVTVARDPVNQPMIRHLTDALGDRNPVYVDEEFAARSVHGGIVAPATALQVWTMRGLAPPSPAAAGQAAADPEMDPNRILDEAGYVGVVATNCEQTYHRYLRPGDLLSVTSSIESISTKKHTGLGIGYFHTSLQTYRDQHGEIVGEMRFRILKFIPGTGKGGTGKGAKPKEDAPAVPAAAANGDAPAAPKPLDSAFWWEGVEAGELRIQRCTGCGTLRHPPRPMCPHCHSLDKDYVVASGRGTVYSYVVHHHPPVPGFEMPFAVAIVELEEGTRVVGNVIDIPTDDVHVGLEVEVAFVPSAKGRVLPQWRPRGTK